MWISLSVNEELIQTVQEAEAELSYGKNRMVKPDRL